MKKKILRCKDCNKPLFISGMSVSGKAHKKYKFFLHYSCRDLNCTAHENTFFIEAQKMIKVSQDEWLYLFQQNEKEKLCSKCGKNKSLTKFYKYESSGNKYTYWCKKCIDYYIKNTSVGAN